MFLVTVYDEDGTIIHEIETSDLSEVFSPLFLRAFPHLQTSEVFEDEEWAWGEIENVTIRVEKII